MYLVSVSTSTILSPIMYPFNECLPFPFICLSGPRPFSPLQLFPSSRSILKGSRGTGIPTRTPFTPICRFVQTPTVSERCDLSNVVQLPSVSKKHRGITCTTVGYPSQVFTTTSLHKGIYPDLIKGIRGTGLGTTSPLSVHERPTHTNLSLYLWLSWPSDLLRTSVPFSSSVSLPRNMHFSTDL